MVVDSALEKDTAVPMNPEEYANHTNGAPQLQQRQQPKQHTHHQRTIGVPARKKRTQTRKQRELQTERFQSTCALKRKRNGEEVARKEKERIAGARAGFFRPRCTGANNTNMDSTTINDDGGGVR